MPDALAAHLTDEALNEYLDAARPPNQQAAAAAHLAACHTCTARLEALRVVFTDLAGLPEEPLTRDLAAGVLAKLPQAVPVIRPAPRRRALGWIVAAQAIVTALVGVLAGPVIVSTLLNSFYPFATPGPNTPAFIIFLHSLPSFWPYIIWNGWNELTALPPFTWVPANWSPVTGLAPLTVGLALAAAGVLWLAGNTVLLRRRA